MLVLARLTTPIILAASLIAACRPAPPATRYPLRGRVVEVQVADRQITIANIQKTVAEYFKIRIADLQSKDRSRTVARPRQMAMALTKELTNHSLPEIGDAFGGRDHTTVLHACRKISELLEANTQTKEDHANLQRLLAR